MSRRSRIGIKVGKIIACVIVFGGLFTFAVMSLWNAILPDVIHVSPINFWQALGILILSKILFSGMGGGGGGWKGRGRNRWKEKMADKWDNMSEEERERFKSRFRDRCGNWGRGSFFDRFDQQRKAPEEKGEAGAE